MNSSLKQVARLSPHPHPQQHPPSVLQARPFARITPLQRAKWDLAVREELAMPGHMELAPVLGDGGEVIDFIWLAASPTSTRAFGCAGEDLVGRTLKRVLVEGSIDGSVFASYRTVFLQKRAQVLPVECKGWDTVHCISPLLSGLAVKVTCNASMDRVLEAQLLVQALK